MTKQSSGEQAHSTDGRHQRRHRNRETALDALVALIDEGHVYPTAAEVAERAGLSARSMFRYFEDVADLHQEAFNRISSRAAPAVQSLVVDASLPLRRRVDEVAQALDRLYALVRPAAVAARLRIHESETLPRQMAVARGVVRSYLAATFAPELEARAPKARQQLLAALEMWCTFETQHLLRHQGALEGADPVEVTVLGLLALLDRS